jgi:hypothetical protein
MPQQQWKVVSMLSAGIRVCMISDKTQESLMTLPQHLEV